MLSVIWLFIIILSLVYGLLTNVIQINNVILNVSYNSLDTFFSIACGLILWGGVLEVAKTTGFLKFCTKKINGLTKLLFETRDENTLSLISGNFICNFLGLSTMATPFGLEAVTELKKEKTKTDINLLLLINYVAATIMPISVLTLRSAYSSNLTIQIIPFITILGLVNLLIGITIIKVYKCFT